MDLLDDVLHRAGWKTMARSNFLCDFLLSIHESSCEQFCCMYYVLWHCDIPEFWTIIMIISFDYSLWLQTKHMITYPHVYLPHSSFLNSGYSHPNQLLLTVLALYVSPNFDMALATINVTQNSGTPWTLLHTSSV